MSPKNKSSTCIHRPTTLFILLLFIIPFRCGDEKLMDLRENIPPERSTSNCKIEMPNGPRSPIKDECRRKSVGEIDEQLKDVQIMHRDGFIDAASLTTDHGHRDGVTKLT